MKKVLFVLITSLILLSCNHSKSNTDSSNTDVATKATNEIVYTGEFLSFDVKHLKDVNGDYSKLTTEEQAAISAAIHRFYSYVNTEEGLWKINVTSGKQIGMDEDLFQFFLTDMNKTMDAVKKLRAQGKTVHVEEITEMALASILKP